MSHRRPRTAVHSSALPSLAALLASGVTVEGCGDPATVADARRERLSGHGESAASAFQGGRFGESAREVMVGLGLIDPPPARIVSRGGAVAVADPQPPVPSGGVAPVQPMPPPPPDLRDPFAQGPSHTASTPVLVAPTPPRPTPPVVHHAPPHPAVPGGMRMVLPDER